MESRSVVNRNRQSDEGIEEMVPKLYRYCQFLTKNKWDGEDLAQESIYKALCHYPDHRTWSSSLLNKMAYHLWIDKVRKQSRETIGQVPELGGEDDLKEDSNLNMIDTLSKKLTPKQLITFILKEAFQYKISEVADMLGLTETAVKALLNRSRAKVKKISEDDEWNDCQTNGDENLQKELHAILYRSLKAQDPSLLIAYIPMLLAYGPVQMNVQTTSSPSNVLSMAA